MLIPPVPGHKEALERLKRQGVEFVQLEMPDLSGQLRGKIVPLSKALSESGSEMSCLTFGLRSADEFTATTWGGGETGFPKVVAVADPATAVQWPWRTEMASVLCNWYMADGSVCPMDGRQILSRVSEALAERGFEARAACEFEFYMYRADRDAAQTGAYRTLKPWGATLDAYSLTRGDGFSEFAVEFMRRMHGVDVPMEAFHTEYGHGMNEFTSAHQPALKAADDAARSKLYLRQLAAEHGLVPTFMAAPGMGEADSFSGCHHNVSLWRDGKNAFWDPQANALSTVGRHFVAGMLRTMHEFHLLFRPWVNSHRRMDREAWNPDNATWGLDNHIAAVRLVHGSKPEQYTRFEHRAPGPDANFHLSLAAMLWGGLQGIEQELEPPRQVVGDPGNEFESLPRSLGESIDRFHDSEAADELFGSAFVEHFVAVKRDELDSYIAWCKDNDVVESSEVTRWEYDHYFTWV